MTTIGYVGIVDIPIRASFPGESMIEINSLRWKGFKVVYSFNSAVQSPKNGWYNNMSMFMNCYKIVYIYFREKEISIALLHAYPKLLKALIDKIILNITGAE